MLVNIAARSQEATEQKALALYLLKAAITFPAFGQAPTPRGIQLLYIQTPNSLANFITKENPSPDEASLRDAIYNYASLYLIKRLLPSDTPTEFQNLSKSVLLKLLDSNHINFATTLTKNLIIRVATDAEAANQAIIKKLILELFGGEHLIFKIQLAENFICQLIDSNLTDEQRAGMTP